jgi:MSHA pilin protein MshA
MIRNQSGFTLIEILMVVLLVAILAAVSIPQFIDFRVEAKDAATQSAAGTLRSAIANQYANIAVRCGANPGTFPTAAQIAANDITTGANPCTTTEVPVVSDRQFVAGAGLPDNPWSGTGTKNAAVACVGAATGCNQLDATACDGNAYTAASSGWCYNPATGQIWANSQNSTGPAKENTF